jgi:site-specific recombinase XerD
MTKNPRGVFERPRGSGVWWVLSYDAQGKRHREKAGTKSAAIRLRAVRQAAKFEGRKMPDLAIQKRIVKFSELCKDAQEHAEHENGPSAQSNLRGIIAALLPDFGDRGASSISTPELLVWLRARGKTCEWSDGTYNHYVTQLRVIYRISQENKKVEVNPALGLKRRMLGNDKPRYLRDDEASRLESVILERWPMHWNAFLFARNTGLRASAQFNLRWDQIDMQRRTLTLPAKRNSKYRKSRVLPLNSVAYDALVDMRARSEGSPLVFAEYHAGPEYLSKPAHWFPEIVKAAGIENFTWHSLRHDFASQLVMNGANLKTVQTLMCHANISQTAIYADLSPEHLQSAVECLTTTKTATRVLKFPKSA